MTDKTLDQTDPVVPVVSALIPLWTSPGPLGKVTVGDFTTYLQTNLLTATTAAKGLVTLATSAEAIAGTNTTKALTPEAFAARTALVTRTGLVQLASQAEVNAGVNAAKAVTPETLSVRLAALPLVPTGGTALQQLRIAADATTREWFTPGAAVAVGLARNISSGRYHAPDTMTFGSTTTSFVGSNFYAYPFSRAMDIDAICIEVTTGTAGTFMGAIYSCNADGYPDQLIEAGTAISTSTTGIKASLLSAPRRLDAPCWIVVQTSLTVTCRSGPTAASPSHGLFGATSMNPGSNIDCQLSVFQTYGPFPATFPASANIATGATALSVAVRSA